MDKNVDALLAEKKYATLLDNLRSLKRVLIAFSGGVDSSLLLFAAKQALGGENVLAVTERSGVLPQRDLRDADSFCKEFGVRHRFFDFDELAVPGYADNPPNRCYICKKTLFTNLLRLAAEEKAVLCEGSNLDDLSDYRPGLKALAELGVASPLRSAQLTKAEIRFLSKKFALPTWNKPSFACLASRFAYGEKITATKLQAVDEAEEFLAELGFSQFRVRVHGDLARVEVAPAQLGLAAKEPLRSEIYHKLRELGFTYVALDLAGYRMGSMNESLKIGG